MPEQEIELDRKIAKTERILIRNHGNEEHDRMGLEVSHE